MKIEKVFKYLILANIVLFISIIYLLNIKTQIIELSQNLDKGFFDTSIGIFAVIFY